jgi:hypothetical protein
MKQSNSRQGEQINICCRLGIDSPGVGSARCHSDSNKHFRTPLDGTENKATRSNCSNRGAARNNVREGNVSF